MSDLDPSTRTRQAPVYRIRLQGHLGRRWAQWFEGWSIALEDGGNTVLTGPVADQAQLHGLLRRVRDLGMPILSVVQVEPARTAATPSAVTDDLHTPHS